MTADEKIYKHIHDQNDDLEEMLDMAIAGDSEGLASMQTRMSMGAIMVVHDTSGQIGIDEVQTIVVNVVRAYCIKARV